MMILLMLLLSKTWALDWRIGGNSIEVVFLQEFNVLVSNSCVKNKKCLALQAVRNKKQGDFSSQVGANPGSRVCYEFQGTVFIANTSDGGSEAFCRFKDKSFVALRGIWK
ncbi:MAG: hypothetical protein AB7I27_04335 [Bacteriovoracaceae bacterium]